MFSVTLLRRFLVLAALMFWQGGFTFYAAVVVEVGRSQVGHRTQGFITGEVTNYLNIGGAIALAIFAWDLACLSGLPRHYRLLWLSWAGMLATLGILAVLHRELEDLMVFQGRVITDLPYYVALHRWYLWVSTAQWAFALGYAWLTLAAWRMVDRTSPKEAGGSNSSAV
jgi:hypothetical protein